MIKITFLGDIMCDNAMSRTLEKYRNADGRYVFTHVFDHLGILLGASDYTIANLETPISISNSNLTNKQWEFCAPIEFAEAVNNCGVTFVTTANNHCLDRGLAGVDSTIDSLNQVGLDHCGIQKENKNSYRVISVSGVRFGILAYTYGTNAFSNHNYLPKKRTKSVNLLQAQEGRVQQILIHLFHGHFKRFIKKLSNLLYPNNRNLPIFEQNTFSFFRKHLIRRDIKHVKRENPDYIIACLHIGGQYNRRPSTYTACTTDWFLKRGCDFVIDNHEHVIHGSKVSSNQLAAYALGNCLGTAGVLREPFDRRSEYSIAIHVYINEITKKIEKRTFSVLKTELSNTGLLEVWPVVDLVRTHNNPEAIIRDALSAAFDFSGVKYSELHSEFELISVGVSNE